MVFDFCSKNLASLNNNNGRKLDEKILSVIKSLAHGTRSSSSSNKYDVRPHFHKSIAEQTLVANDSSTSLSKLPQASSSCSSSSCEQSCPSPAPPLRFNINDASVDTTFYKLSQGTLRKINAQNTHAEKYLNFDLKKNVSLDSVSSQLPILPALLIQRQQQQLDSSNSDGGSFSFEKWRFTKTRLLYVLLAVFLIVFIAIVAAILGLYFKENGKL
jgi:hypothetical protein